MVVMRKWFGHNASTRCRNYVFKTKINHTKNIAPHECMSVL